MQKLTDRIRNVSVSDVHIQQCDCSYCDGIGQLIDDGVPFATLECPACEGLGYLTPVSHDAYNAYLKDLYAEVVQPMTSSRRPAPYQPAKAAA